MKGHVVQSINVGNLRKTTGVRCCETPPITDDEIDIVAVGLTGNVKFKEGYSMTAYVGAVDRTITFVPIVGAGMGICCNPPLPVPGTTPDCGDLIFTINGVTPAESGAFTFNGSNGIYVDPYPSLHKIVIRGAIEGQLICTT
jgi:hypothetical protein